MKLIRLIDPDGNIVAAINPVHILCVNNNHYRDQHSTITLVNGCTLVVKIDLSKLIQSLLNLGTDDEPKVWVVTEIFSPESVGDWKEYERDNANA